MGVVVQKYGGSSVADVDRIPRSRIARPRTRARARVVVVVSAMGDTTDELLALAHRVTRPSGAARARHAALRGRADLDGAARDGPERRGVPAVSFTGSQSGIITNDAHANARIVEVRPFRVEDELARGKVVIVAGYQGVSYKREVTTLGRGGSDTTAVALAAALGRRGLRDLQRRRRRLLRRPARRARGAAPLRDLLRGDAGARGGGGEGPERAGGRVREGARHRDLRARHFGGTEETVVRRFPPAAPGRVVGCRERDGARAPGGRDRGARAGSCAAARSCSTRGAPGKQLRYEVTTACGASLVLSLENLHDFEPSASSPRRLRGCRLARRAGCRLRDRRGDQRHASRTCGSAAPLGREGLPVLGLSTSSFRISVLVREAPGR